MLYHMTEDAKSDSSDEASACEAPTCSWCGGPLYGREVGRGLVCEKCVRLLRDEDLNEEMTFDPREET